MYKYMIYGKYKNKRFKPYDSEEQRLVTNLLYASMYHDYDLMKLKVFVSGMNEDNKDYKFEIRSI